MTSNHIPGPNQTPRIAQNLILSSLPSDEWRRIQPLLTPVDLEQGEILYETDTPVEQVHFIDEGMISVVSIMHSGDSIEVGTIGNEGMAGHSLVLGVDRMPFRHIVQVAGRARRLPAAAFTAEIAEGRVLRQLLNRYYAAFNTQVMQGMACNGLHSVVQRCCRWLLTTQDRLGSRELRITHEFLAQMLGVRRASVTDVLRPLQTDGLILTRRGQVTIMDSEGLAAAACECYGLIRRAYERLL
jgi:CRP-like cAMP-binding protein